MKLQNLCSEIFKGNSTTPTNNHMNSELTLSKTENTKF